jgi:hypothetical protein
MVQIGLDLGMPHLVRMAFAVEQDELANPVSIGFLRLLAKVTASTNDADLVEKAGAVASCITP